MYIQKRLSILISLTLFIFLIIGGLYFYIEKSPKKISNTDILSLENKETNTQLLDQKQRGVPVLLYHIVSSNIQKGSYGVISKELFIQQLDYLVDEGYVTISLDDLYNYMETGKEIPLKSIILSFDDTNESDYEIVFQELKKREFKGVFFTIGNKAITPIWQNRLREMYKDGMEIASHTMNHKYSGGGPNSNGTRKQMDDLETIKYELKQAKKILEDITGSEIKYLAWPGDSYTDSMIEIAKEIGYKGLFMAKTDYTENIMKHPISKSGFNKIGDDVSYIKRITINGSDSFDNFKNILNDGIYPRP